jgi:hypothetical protein
VAKSATDPVHGSAIIAAEIEAIVGGRPGRVVSSTKGFGADPSIADNLGRASHLIEDFFAHSNFVELAADKTRGQTIGPEPQKTAAFEAPDKAHSLAGKLRGPAAEMRAHRNLIPLIGDAAINGLEWIAGEAESASRALGPKPGSHTHGSAIIAAEIEAIAGGRPGRVVSSTKGFGADPSIADNLGRASHHPLKNVYGGGAAAP